MYVEVPAAGTHIDKDEEICAMESVKSVEPIYAPVSGTIVECDISQKDEVAKILKQNMESIAPELGVKLVVDVTSGSSWGEL